MLLNRQKVLLSYIYLAGKIESKTVLTKSVFLLCNEELKDEKLYDFLPYNFGPYSFCLNNIDVKSLKSKGLISAIQNRDGFSYEIKDRDSAKKIISGLGEKIISSVNNIYKKYGKFKAWEIKNYVYSKYPYFAIRNKKTASLYSRNDPANDEQLQEDKIFTIGYEGKSIDKFLDELIKNNIKVLVDVRNNPKSMKYGFSGNSLKHYSEEINVEYEHIPELGIQSQFRQDLNNEKDYEKLFILYKNKMLPENYEKMKVLKNLIRNKKRIALMCFEKDYKQCHRGILSEEFKNYCNNKYGVLHI